MAFLRVQAPEDDVTGLDVKGGARQKYNPFNKQFDLTKSKSSIDPFAHSHDPFSSNRITRRGEGRMEKGSDGDDQQEQATSRQSSINAKKSDSQGPLSQSNTVPQRIPSSTIRRKEVPTYEDMTASRDFALHGENVSKQHASNGSAPRKLFKQWPDK